VVEFILWQLHPEEIIPVPVMWEAGVGHRAGVDVSEKRETSCLYRDSNPDCLARIVDGLATSDTNNDFYKPTHLLDFMFC
jgi:hypothetical protein